MQQNTRIALKRTHWKTQLRRQDIQSMFSKRRQELTTAHFTQTDSEAVTLILHLIQNISREFLERIVGILVEMDNSLGLLFAVTAILPQNVPAFFANIIHTILGLKGLPQKIELQFIRENRSWLATHRQSILLIGRTFETWFKHNGESFLKVKSLLQAMQEMELAAQSRIIEFIGVMTNILLIVVWAQQLLLADSDSMNENPPTREHQLKSCQYILTNFLAVKDEVIVPHLPSIFQHVSNHIKCVGLYFNLFLVSKVSPDLRFGFFKNYLRLLSLNSQELMEQHQELVFILANCLKFMPQIPAQLEQEYTQCALKLQELLSQLLKVINLRYENTSLYLPAHSISADHEDKVFLHHFSIILEKLAEEKYVLRALMESSPVLKFILNNLQPADHMLGYKISTYMALLLAKSTNDEYAFAQFADQPRLMQKLLKIIGRLKGQDLDNKQLLLFLTQILFTLSNCCTQPQLLVKCLQHQLIETVVQVYFKLPRTQASLELGLQCKYLYLNLIMGAKSYLTEESEQREAIIGMLFGNQSCKGMYIECLSQGEIAIASKAVQLLSFLVVVEERGCYNRCLEQFLSNRCLEQQLSLMKMSQRQSLWCLGEKGMAVLGSRMKRHQERQAEQQEWQM